MPGVDFDRDAQPGVQRGIRVEVFKMEAYRQTLNDLYPIAGGVLGRQQRKGQPRAGAQTFDLRRESNVGIGIDLDCRLLTRPHMSELGLFEIGLDPDPVT